MIKNISLFNISLLTAAFFLGLTQAKAFYTVQDTGEILPPGQFAIIGEGQIVTSRDSGFNIVGKVDMGLNDEIGFRALAGAGNTDFQFGGFAKWVPFPDFEKQPAVGIIGGVHLARYKSNTETSLRAMPIVSKRIVADFGILTPYGSLPFALRSFDSKTETPLHVAGGAFYSHPDLKGFEFTGELGISLNKAFTYISLGVVMPLDESHRFEFLD